RESSDRTRSFRKSLSALIMALVTVQSTAFMGIPQSGALAQTSPPDPTKEPLVQSSDLQLIGGIRAPNGNFGTGDNANFSYGGQTLAYCKEHGTLFLEGHTYDHALAEISIPPLVNSSNIDSLNTATVLQPFRSFFEQLTNNSADPVNEM